MPSRIEEKDNPLTTRYSMPDIWSIQARVLAGDLHKDHQPLEGHGLH